MRPIELLLPAGDFEKMKFAFEFGADAVYLGIPRFSLRARENEFKRDTVKQALAYAREAGKKVYITANIFPHNRKVQPFIEYIDDFLIDINPDAWIMSDPGMIMKMREKHPQQIIHLSVQANTVNYLTVKFWQQLGVKRIILSRELSIDEIREIRDHNPDIELEAFVHGAICVAYSGRCLISNYLASRDPNQGTCPNSCRWKYQIYKKDIVQPDYLTTAAQSETETTTQHDDRYIPLDGEYALEEVRRPGKFLPIDEDEHGTYLMNSRDLCAIEYLDELYQAGIDSFKVEGRTKSVYYVSLIARAYRRAIDDIKAEKAFNRDHLRDIFATANKGFIAGFLKGNPGRSAQKFDSDFSEYSSYRFSGIVRDYDEKRKLMHVSPRNKLYEQMKLELILKDKTIPFVVDVIFDKKMNQVAEIHGGQDECWIPYPENPGEFALLREQIAAFEPDEVHLSRNF